MAQRRRPGQAAPGKTDGAWAPSMGFIALALALVAGVLIWWWRSTLSAGPDDTPPVAPRPLASAASVPAPTTSTIAASGPLTAVPLQALAAASSPAIKPRIWRMRDPNGDQTPDLADYVNEGERPTMAEVIDRLHQSGVYTGLGAFSPPGTRPPLVGLAVPEDFVLPPGYVRHYQATDDGQRIEPILMFAPDRPFFDAANRPITVPKDRVVPPEMALPGLPIRRIVVPAPVDAPRPGG